MRQNDERRPSLSRRKPDRDQPLIERDAVALAIWCAAAVHQLAALEEAAAERGGIAGPVAERGAITLVHDRFQLARYLIAMVGVACEREGQYHGQHQGDACSQYSRHLLRVLFIARTGFSPFRYQPPGAILAARTNLLAPACRLLIRATLPQSPIWLKNDEYARRTALQMRSSLLSRIY